METPSLQKIINKGIFKSFDVPSGTLAITVPRFNIDTGEKVNLDMNLNIEYYTNKQVELEAEITEKRKEKNDIIALLAKFQLDIDTVKAKIMYNL